MFTRIYDKQFIYLKIINVNSNYVQLIMNNINEYKKLVNIQMQYAIYQNLKIKFFKRKSNYKSENI